MKKIHLIGICILSGISGSAIAQHCPFDGSSAVVIKVVDKKGRLVKNLETPVLLAEVNNPYPDSCSFMRFPVLDTFRKTRQVIFNNRNEAWVSYTKKFSDCAIFGEGCYMVKLGMAETDCMIDRGTDYRYLKRKFVIRYTPSQSKKEREIKVAENKVYSLCTSSGSWCRIEMYTVVL